MVYILKCMLGEMERQIILSVTVLTNMIIIICFIRIGIGGVAIKWHYVPTLRLIEGLNPDLALKVLITTTVMAFIIHLMELGVIRAHLNVHARKTGDVMAIFLICDVILFVAVAIILSFSYFDLKRLDERLSTDLNIAMQKYKTSTWTKENVDDMQQLLSCCGVHNFSEWLEVDWYDENLVSQEYSKKLVPYSCCNPAAKRACITHSITSDVHDNYKYPKDITIFTDSCFQTFTGSFSIYFSSHVIWPCVLICGCYVLHTLLIRYTHTSISGAIRFGHPGLPAYGYLLSWGEYAKEIEYQAARDFMKKHKKAGAGMFQKKTTTTRKKVRRQLKMIKSEDYDKDVKNADASKKVDDKKRSRKGKRDSEGSSETNEETKEKAKDKNKSEEVESNVDKQKSKHASEDEDKSDDKSVHKSGDKSSKNDKSDKTNRLSSKSKKKETDKLSTKDKKTEKSSLSQSQKTPPSSIKPAKDSPTTLPPNEVPPLVPFYPYTPFYPMYVMPMPMPYPPPPPPPAPSASPSPSSSK